MVKRRYIALILALALMLQMPASTYIARAQVGPGAPLAPTAACPGGLEPAASLTVGDPTFMRPNGFGPGFFYDVYSYTLTGANPQDIVASFCQGGAWWTFDTYLYLYQAPGGTANPFNPANPTVNLVASNDNFCFLGSEISYGSLVPGDVDVVVTSFWPLATGNYQLYVNSTTCAANGPPVAVDDGGAGYTTDEDTGFTTADVRSNDSDPDSDPLSVASFDATGTQGLVSDAGGGMFDYDPNGQFESLAVGEQATDSFTYVVSDGVLTDTATVSITINGANDAPVAVDDGGVDYTTDEDTGFSTGNVLVNDNDPDASDSLSVDGFDATGTQGLVIDNGDGTFDYDPNGQFENLAVGEQAFDAFTYVASDGTLTDTATVSITVTGVNDDPTANDDFGLGYATDEDTPFITGDVLYNDTDPDDSDVLSVDQLHVDNTKGLVSDKGDGTFDYDPNGQFDYLAPGEDAFDSFKYTITDGNGGSDFANVAILIYGVNDAPQAEDDGYVTAYETKLTVLAATGVLTNDLDAEDDPLTAVLDTTPAGDLDLQADGSFVYTPTLGFTGPVTFTYHANDGLADSNVATVTINVLDPTDTDLEMGKQVDDPTPEEGGTIVYTLTVTNNGPADATGIEVSDTLPAGVTYVDDDGAGDYDGSTWDVGALANGESATLHITATVDVGTGGTAITNTATITASDQDDPVTGNDEANAAITVAPTDADLEMGKDVDDATPEEGGTIVYTLTVTNNGPADATGIEVGDTLPAGVTYVDDDGGGDYDGFTWDVGALANGESATLHVTATVDVGTGGTTITNTASISAADQADPDADNDEAQAGVQVQGAVDITAPEVIAVSPVDKAVDVAVDAALVITFSEAIDTGTFAYTVVPDPGGWSLTWNGDKTVATLVHDDFDYWEPYAATVTAAEDLTGNPMAGPYPWSFTTAPYEWWVPVFVMHLSQ